MFRMLRPVLLVLVLITLMPAVVGAQEPLPPRTIDPPIVVPPCPAEWRDCWWPVIPVAQLDRFEAQLTVSDGVVRAHYRLHLSNRGEQQAEGRIVVPVPPGSSVADLVLAGGPETLEGSILDADEAQRIYEAIVRRRIDPALLRSLGRDLFEVRAFPVPAGEEREVSFTVTTPLTAEGDQVTVEIPWSRMSPRPGAATVTADVDVPWELRSALAPGHQLDVERLGEGRISASWESPDGWGPDSDFRLYLTGGEGLLSTRVLAHRVPGEDGYFALLFAPAIEVEARVDRDLVLVLDTSGSMDGEKLAQAKQAARYVLEHLGSGDRFGIVAFSRSVRLFGEGLHPAADAADGIGYVDLLTAAGGTNISGALQRGFELGNDDRPLTVIFLTDGLPTVGPVSPDAILQLADSAAPERAQLFAFGVGYDVDTILLDSLADRFVGSSHYVTPEERVDTEVIRLFERISTPILTDVEITVSGGDTYDLAPRGISGLFAGSQALLTGRYSTPGPATVTVRGNAADGEQTLTYEVTFPERDVSDPTIAQLWAQRRVADLLTELRIEGERSGLVDEIVAIATRFGIVTPFTSYLAEEPELAFSPTQAARAVADAAAAAPASGESAVAGAEALEELRAGGSALGGGEIRVVGASSYFLLDGVWVADGYDRSTAAPEVEVGSERFASLIAAQPAIASAAALGERVVVRAPDGWITVIWPDVEPDTVVVVVPPSETTTTPDATTPDVTTPDVTTPENATPGVAEPAADADAMPSDGRTAVVLTAVIGVLLVVGVAAGVIARRRRAS